MNEDAALLRRYAENGSEDAFTEFVQRHIDLVYSAALRRTGGDAHRAADVAQQVFTTVARRAHKLSGHPALSAWLHTATRNAALNLMIAEQRRHVREAAALNDPSVAADSAVIGADWANLRPVLDAAIDELPETDRVAVVLRFLERRPFAEIAAALHVSADAARMRTDRALDKLRAALAKRGITSTAAALGALVSSQPAVSAPAGLATTLASKSLTASGAGLGLAAAGFISFMNSKAIVTAFGTAVAAFSLGAYVGLDYTTSQPLPPPPEMPRHSHMIASLREENLRLKANLSQLQAANTKLMAQASAPRATPASPSGGATVTSTPPTGSRGAQQRAMLNNLRMIEAARDQFLLEHRRPPSSLDELVGLTKYIKQLTPIDGESYHGINLGVRAPMTVTTANGVSVTFDPAGVIRSQLDPLTPEEQAAQAREQRLSELNRKVQSSVKKASEAYSAAHKGARPRTPEDLLPYFATPEEGADFVELIEANKTLAR